mmetsp:Transcript_12020/g.51615  ORF Transcript_12020/g.51615 Transcript_12020/m.51615 type:complete len:456 (+) Transcript_12020:2591-3958(+)
MGRRRAFSREGDAGAAFPGDAEKPGGPVRRKEPNRGGRGVEARRRVVRVDRGAGRRFLKAFLRVLRGQPRGVRGVLRESHRRRRLRERPARRGGVFVERRRGRTRKSERDAGPRGRRETYRRGVLSRDAKYAVGSRGRRPGQKRRLLRARDGGRSNGRRAVPVAVPARLQLAPLPLPPRRSRVYARSPESAFRFRYLRRGEKKRAAGFEGGVRERAHRDARAVGLAGRSGFVPNAPGAPLGVALVRAGDFVARAGNFRRERRRAGDDVPRAGDFHGGRGTRRRAPARPVQASPRAAPGVGDAARGNGDAARVDAPPGDVRADGIAPPVRAGDGFGDDDASLPGGERASPTGPGGTGGAPGGARADPRARAQLAGRAHAVARAHRRVPSPGITAARRMRVPRARHIARLARPRANVARRGRHRRVFQRVRRAGQGSARRGVPAEHGVRRNGGGARV